MKAREIKKLRRAKEYRSRNAAENRFEQKLLTAMSGCSNRVLKAVESPSIREVKEVEFVTRENPEYRKVNNPYGQLTNSRQKMRGCCIPLI